VHPRHQSRRKMIRKIRFVQQHHCPGVSDQSGESTGGGCSDAHHHDVLVLSRDIAGGIVMGDVREEGEVTWLGVVDLLGQGL